MASPNPPELILNSVSQLAMLVEKYGDTIDLYFRGQSAQYASVTTSLERHVRTTEDLERARARLQENGDEYISKDPYASLATIEGYNLYTFKRRARNLLTDLPSEDDYAEWFSLMQHYGAPTRLLDVSKSIFVALYFATAH